MKIAPELLIVSIYTTFLPSVRKYKKRIRISATFCDVADSFIVAEFLTSPLEEF